MFQNGIYELSAHGSPICPSYETAYPQKLRCGCTPQTGTSVQFAHYNVLKGLATDHSFY